MRTPFAIAMLVMMTGCFGPGFTARKVAEAQAPGVATGAGATLSGPANSAASSTQVAERRVAYQPIPRPSAVAAPEPQRPSVPMIMSEPPPITVAPQSAPAWTYERTETTLGQHQDAAGIVKVAATMSGWSTVKWIGLICILTCIGGLLWSHGNPDGYPLVFWKVGGIGLFLVLVGDHPAWLLLLLLPLGWYAVQKLNLLRIP